MHTIRQRPLDTSALADLLSSLRGSDPLGEAWSDSLTARVSTELPDATTIAHLSRLRLEAGALRQARALAAAALEMPDADSLARALALIVLTRTHLEGADLATARRALEELAALIDAAHEPDHPALDELVFLRARLAAHSDWSTALGAIRAVSFADPDLAAEASLWLYRRAVWMGDVEAAAAGRELMASAVGATNPLAGEEIRALVEQDPQRVLDAATGWLRAGRPAEAARAHATALLMQATSRRERPSRVQGDMSLQISRLRQLGMHLDAEMLAAAAAASGLHIATTTLLCETPMGSRLDAASIALLEPQIEVRQLSAGEELYGRGDQLAHMFVVAEGMLRLHNDSDDGRLLTIDLVTRGELAGEDALSTAGSAAGSVQAIEASTVLAVPIAALLECSEDAYRELLGVATRRSARSAQLAHSLASEPVSQRLARTVLDLADRFGHPTMDGNIIVNRALTHEQLAGLAGSTRKTITLELSDWRGSGILEVRKRKLVLCDRAALERLAKG